VLVVFREMSYAKKKIRKRKTNNQILAEMDGFAQNDNVLVIGATNRKDVLDNARLQMTNL